MDIIREPLPSEVRGDPADETSKAFEPILLPGGRIPKTPHVLFEEVMSKESQKATRNKLPFAEATARADYRDKLEEWEKTYRRQGYAIKKKPTFEDIDWGKYSDLKNFELIDEGQTRDKGLSKEYKVSVFVRWKKYKFKGFSNTYTVMEDPDDSLARTLGGLNVKDKAKVER